MRPTIQQLSQQVLSRSISPVELTEDCLARIEKRNPELNAFITVLADSALDQPAAPSRRSSGATTAARCTASPSDSKTSSIPPASAPPPPVECSTKDRIPTEDAEVVRRLRAAAQSF